MRLLSKLGTKEILKTVSVLFFLTEILFSSVWAELRMTLQRRCSLSAGGSGRLIPLNAGKAKWAVRTVLFQQWDDTAKPCADEGAAIVPTLPVLRSLLLNRFLKWGVSKGAHPCNLDFRQEMIFVVLSFLLGATSQPFVCFLWSLPGGLCGEDLCKIWYSYLIYSMPADSWRRAALLAFQQNCGEPETWKFKEYWPADC